MHLFDRITTLIKADAHGVVESLEERSLLLKQYVREAEMDLQRKRARLDSIREEDQRLGEALVRCEEEIRSLDEDVELALGGGKDELARFAIRRLLPRRSQVKALREEMQQRRAEGEALAMRLAVQEKQFETLRTRVRAELAHEDEGDLSCAWLGERGVADEDVEIELMRRRQGRDAREEQR
jgi:phage shock protein A